MIQSGAFFLYSRHGAEEVRDSDTAKGRGPGAFIGSGYRLGDTEGTASEKISGLPVQERTRQVCTLVYFVL